MNGTYYVVPLRPGSTPIDCKWIYKVKQHVDGSIDKYKARLGAKGFSQPLGFDFQETFNPSVQYSTMQIVLTLAMSYKRSLKHIDVNNALIHRDLLEDVYTYQPPGLEKHDASGNVLVCKLRKALYGLKHAPRA